jgi:phosphatidylserine decarboxylase
MKFNCLSEPLQLDYQGPNRIACNARYGKGDDMGYFQHGSTIIVFASKDYSLCDTVNFAERIQMGQPLLEYSGEKTLA